jgi:predicted neutral ceramidase superfamily lipid hydrolase
MELFINPWAVLVAGVVSMIIGAFWYSPLLFSKPWLAILGVTPEQIAEAKAKGMKGMTKSFVIGFISALVTSYFLALLLSAFAPATVWWALVIAFAVWLGFMAVIHIDSVIWEKRPWKFFWINAGCRLVTLLIIALILHYWK